MYEYNPSIFHVRSLRAGELLGDKALNKCGNSVALRTYEVRRELRGHVNRCIRGSESNCEHDSHKRSTVHQISSPPTRQHRCRCERSLRSTPSSTCRSPMSCLASDSRGGTCSSPCAGGVRKGGGRTVDANGGGSVRAVVARARGDHERRRPAPAPCRSVQCRSVAPLRRAPVRHYIRTHTTAVSCSVGDPPLIT